MRSRMAEAPVAFFGFDAAESSLVRHGIEEGWLPTLASLAEAGRWAALAPVPSGFYNTSWASTVTGQDVFAHQGLYDRQLEPGSYRIVDVPATSIRQPPFWRYLSDAGVRSTIASIYSAPILPSFRGSQAQGWGSIDPYFAKFEETTFEPPDIEQVLRRAAGARQALYRIRAPRTSDDVRRYRDLLLRSIDQQTRGVIALVEETDWNFFFASFSEPHQAGHLLWHLTDPAHPSYDPEAEADLKEAIVELGRLNGRWPGLAVPGGRAFNPGWNLVFELRNLLIVSEAIARLALQRTESRGAHSRLDHPDANEAEWGTRNGVARRGPDGSMQVTTTTLPEMAAELRPLLGSAH